MNINEKWRSLGWRHPLWDYVRFYSVVQRQKKELREAWKAKLRRFTMEVDAEHELAIPEEHAQLFFDYLSERERDFESATNLLRTEEEAKHFSETLEAEILETNTKNKSHHQSSKAIVAAVSSIAEDHCSEQGMNVVVTPSRRCVWLSENCLHVTARNLDGAIPSLDSPQMIWEIKEYWGKTKGGSKMSDAVYECALVGRELREFEERANLTWVPHIVFIDGQHQWSYRRSDLKRFIDLFHQGLIDHLIIGREVETEWKDLLQHYFPLQSQ